MFPGDIADLSILQSDWFRAFWIVTQEPEQETDRDLCKHKANNMNFHLTPDQEKMTKCL